MAMTRNGQFFLIGGLLIAGLIAGVALASTADLHTPPTYTPRQLFEQSQAEFPTATNIALQENRSERHLQQRLTSYLAFQNHLFQTHGLDAAAHATVSASNRTNTTVLVANFRNRKIRDVEIHLDGVTRTEIAMNDSRVQRFVFPKVSSTTTGWIAFDADTDVNQSLPVSPYSTEALYHLRLQGEDQTWVDTKTY